MSLGKRFSRSENFLGKKCGKHENPSPLPAPPPNKKKKNDATNYDLELITDILEDFLNSRKRQI